MAAEPRATAVTAAPEVRVGPAAPQPAVGPRAPAVPVAPVAAALGRHRDTRRRPRQHRKRRPARLVNRAEPANGNHSPRWPGPSTDPPTVVLVADQPSSGLQHGY